MGGVTDRLRILHLSDTHLYGDGRLHYGLVDTLAALDRVLARAGEVNRTEMLRVFNMGVGMVVVASPDAADAITASARAAGVDAWVIGYTAPGTGRVTITSE